MLTTTRNGLPSLETSACRPVMELALKMELALATRASDIAARASVHSVAVSKVGASLPCSHPCPFRNSWSSQLGVGAKLTTEVGASLEEIGALAAANSRRKSIQLEGGVVPALAVQQQS